MAGARVIAMRQYRMRPERGCVLYVTDQGRWSSELEESSGLPVVEVKSANELEAVLADISAHLLVVEKDVHWACSVELVSELNYLLEVPVLMLAPSCGPCAHDFLRDAYHAGVDDVLYDPWIEQGLNQAMNLLLKLHRSESVR